MTTKELQESVLSKRKNLSKEKAYFYLFFDEDKQIGFPIIFNHNYCNFRTKFRGLCFSTDYSWVAFYCVDKKGKEIYSAYLRFLTKNFLKKPLSVFQLKKQSLLFL